MVCMLDKAIGVARREMQKNFPRCYTDDTRSHHHPGVQLWVGLSRFCWSSWGGLNTGRHAMRMLRFVVHAVGWFHFVVLHGHVSCCDVIQPGGHLLLTYGPTGVRS